MSEPDQKPAKTKRRRTAGVFKPPTNLDLGGYPAHRERDPRGRKTKLNPVVRATLVENILTGAPLEFCAAAAGVSRSVIYDWLGRGQVEDAEGKESEYSVLFRDVARARAKWWVATYGKISLGEQGWQGRAWIAERLDPGRLSPPARRLEHSGPGGGGIRMIASSVEIPNEVPEDHPSLAAGGAGLVVSNGSNGHATNGNGSHHIGVELPEESDPEK